MKMDDQIGIWNMCLSSLLHINMFLSSYCYKILQVYSIITCKTDELGGVKYLSTLYELKLLILCITQTTCTVCSHVSTALILSIVTSTSSLSHFRYDMYLDRLLDRIKEEKGITFEEFRVFCQFLNNLEDFTIAMRMYTLADHPISKGGCAIKSIAVHRIKLSVAPDCALEGLNFAVNGNYLVCIVERVFSVGYELIFQMNVNEVYASKG